MEKLFKKVEKYLRKHLTGAYHVKISDKKQLNFPKLGGIFTLGVILIGLSVEVFKPLLYLGELLIGVSLISYLYFYILKKEEKKPKKVVKKRAKRKK